MRAEVLSACAPPMATYFLWAQRSTFPRSKALVNRLVSVRKISRARGRKHAQVLWVDGFCQRVTIAEPSLESNCWVTRRSRRSMCTFRLGIDDNGLPSRRSVGSRAAAVSYDMGQASAARNCRNG